VLFPLASEPPTGTGASEVVLRNVTVRGGVVLRFGGTERRAPFQDERRLRLAYVPPPQGPDGD